LTDDELPAFVAIAAGAYPALRLHTEDERQQRAERFRARSGPGDRIYGLFRDGRLLGGMRLIDYQMNVRSVTVPTGGVGMVAVDLAHKKEKVARDLIRSFLDRCRESGMPLAGLYPFRIDFYQRMGFGLGPRAAQYSFPPDTLPDRGTRSHLRMLGAEDAEAMCACYARLQARTHGLMVKTGSDMGRLLASPGTRVVGVQAGEALAGYLAFSFDTDPGGHLLKNNLHVQELVYETREALADLLSYLHSQADQVPRVVMETYDEGSHHLLRDPRDESGRMLPHVTHQTNVQGLGLMYRVLDTRALFTGLADADFGGQTVRLKLTVRDSFLPANAGSSVIHFVEGRSRVVGDGSHDVELTVDISYFSSLAMGTASVERLYTYGLAELSDVGYLTTLDRLFAVSRQPVCMTPF
jgi:predicted acetyltransferase